MLPQWIYRNLKEYGNCLIPTKKIIARGIENLEKELSKKVKKKVVIKCVKSKHLYQEIIYNYENYIAEVKENE